jgi:hypothetical protein
MTVTSSDTLLETLIARTIGEEPVYPMGALAVAPIPAGVGRYMRAEITNRLAEDLSRAPHFARVASPTAGPDAIRDALLTHAAGQYIFPRAEFLEMLENATRFTENYLCRPRWTLGSFLFSGQQEITAETLLRKLEYLADYAYLPQLMRRLVTQNGKQVITAAEGVAMIARIDDAVVREHSPREQAMLARPIFEFFVLSSEINNKFIPLRALLLFLEDKQLLPLRNYAEGVWHMRGKNDITMAELSALCEDFVSSSAPAPTEVQIEPAAVELPPTDPAPPLPDLPTPEPVPVEPVPLEAETFTATTPFAPDAELTRPIEEIAEPAPIVAPEPTPEPVPPPIPDAPSVPSLRDTIPADLRRRFINTICGKDAEFYDLVITRLDDMRSWGDASTYIRELFEINSIDPFDQTAVAFTDAIQKRCEQFSQGPA